MQCRRCLTKQVCTMYCIYINYSSSVTYCAFCTTKGKTGTKCPTMTRRVHYKHGDTRPVQTTQVPDSHAHCLAAWCPLSTAREVSISLLATAACASLNLGHSHGRCQTIVNSSDSLIHSLSNAGLQVTANRYMM